MINRYVVTREYVYYENEMRDVRLPKGSIVTFNSHFRDGKRWVNFNKCKYLVDREDLQIVK